MTITTTAAAVFLCVCLCVWTACAARAVNPPDHLSPEHVPPWANPKTEADHLALMYAALPELQPRTDEDLEHAGRPADVIPHQVPSDWLAYEDRRLAFGSSQDWVPIGMLNDRTSVQPVPATGHEITVQLQPRGIVLAGSGLVCVDAEAHGETYRACLPVEELRRLLHGRK